MPSKASIAGLLALLAVPPEALGAERARWPLLVRSERGETADAGALLFAADTNLLESVRSISRDDVVFSAYGSTIRAHYGLDDATEVRARVGWLTVSGSGHSGQFDTGLGMKRALLAADALQLAAVADVRGDKIMGNEPFYRMTAELPLTLVAEPAELTLSPGAALGFGGDSSARFELALSFALRPDPVAPYFEAFWNSREINPRFSRFRDGNGWGYSAGVVIEPAREIRIPVTLLAQAPGGHTQLGIAGISVQFEIRTAPRP